jgi:hypothetical protein
MSRFKISQRRGKFGKFNPRNEKHGAENVPAADVIVVITGGKRDFDIMFPHPSMKLSDVVWVNKRIAMPYVDLANARKLENVTFTCNDQETLKRSKPLEFEGCKVKISDVVIMEKCTFSAKLTIQLHDDVDAHSARLRMLMDNEREFSLLAQQDDFWSGEGDENEPPKQQGELEVGQDDEEEEEEEEETEED